ncbi:MAG: glutamate 5-kinase [Lachnospiraceae bacterium]
MSNREKLKNKKKIVVKIGSSSLVHEETGGLDFGKLEKLVRILSDFRNQGKDVVLVSSGAIGVGRKLLGLTKKPELLPLKQACAAVGQGRLISIYQKLFAEYNQKAAQILITKETMIKEVRRKNARNTFEQLFEYGIIPIVNENDTVSTEEIEFGDNDTLAAVICALVGADLLVLLTDIDGFYTDDPHKNPDAKLIKEIKAVDDKILNMAKGVTSNLGTGGMATKLAAAPICTDSGADMVIASGEDVSVLNDIIEGKEVGTLFLAHKREEFNIVSYIEKKEYLMYKKQYK